MGPRLKRYRDFNTYLRALFGERVQKISLDAGLGCPNRDGTLSREGCVFCDGRGSGTGAQILQGLSIAQQIAAAKAYLAKRYKVEKFIAYFQSFTNTYGPVATLKRLYDEALSQRDMVGLSIGTRPDCVDENVLGLLSGYGPRHLVWIEYGLQSAHDTTLSRINRGHDVACFERAVHLARAFSLNICVHVILGLPGEDREMMAKTARFLSRLPVQGVKIHSLYVVEGTPLSVLYKTGKYRCLTRDAYTELVIDFLERLPREVVVQRLTGDPVKRDLVAPDWAAEKTQNLKTIQRRLEERDTWQGRLYRD